MTSASPRGAIWPFAAAIFCSAFLLFSVQPLIGKYILPWFGGSPATWTTCLLFFQTLLLVGYAYAHALARLPSAKRQAVIHVTLLAAALVTLPVIPSQRWKPTGGQDPTLRILLLLLGAVGLPYTLLAATGPLLQAWVARRGGSRGVYRLYALSNAASFLALVAYPFAIEPLLTRRIQALAWSAGMAGFAIVCAACAALVARSTGVPPVSVDAEKNGDATHFPLGGGNGGGGNGDAAHYILILFLPAVASMLLLAVTNKICQDVAVVPLLWVLPLGLYLLSFVITFDSPRWYDRRLWVPAFFAALAFAAYASFPGNEDLPIPTRVAAYAGALLASCIVCHGELYRLRPPTRRLTAYYLTISAGGALGGLSVALIAPLVFTTYAELPIGLLLAVALLAWALYRDRSGPMHHGKQPAAWIAILVAFTLLSLTLWSGATSHLAGAQVVGRWRNFYGTLTLYAQPHQPNKPLLLHHAGITHGLQLTDPPDARRIPTTYYSPTSGVGLLLRTLAADPHPHRVGIVGLGAGTLAAYARPADRYRFYEINPAVTRLARGPFTFLRDSPAQTTVVEGDGRLSLEREPAQFFDVLVLDAFSGDAIPVHLLTAEAFDLYLRHLQPAGVIAVHVSNQHLDLAPVLARLAAHAGLSAALVHDTPAGESRPYDYESRWILLSRDPARLAIPATQPLKPRPDIPLWTDDYSNLLQILK